jgi:hypothetical protein
MSKTEPLDDGAAFRQGASQFKVSFRQLREESHRSDWAQKNVLIAVPGAEADGTSGIRDANDKTLRQESPPRARVPPICARVPARISSPTRDAVFYSGSMANPFEFRHLTARKCAYIEEQRLRNVAGAFARLGVGQYGSADLGAKHSRASGVSSGAFRAAGFGSGLQNGSGDANRRMAATFDDGPPQPRARSPGGPIH